MRARHVRRHRPRQADGGDQPERRGNRDELRAVQADRGEQQSGADRGIGAKPNRRRRGHGSATAPDRGAGAGTRSRQSRTTSSPETRCTHSSGRSVSRCPSAGTAIAFTSSGETKSRPSSAARQRASLRSASEPRGLAPTCDLRMLAGGRDEVDHVEPDGAVDVNAFDGSLHGQELVARARRCQHDLVGHPLAPALEHLPLVVARRIADPGPHQEAVELRLRQRVRALILDRVLGRDHEERRVEDAGLALDRHLALRHRLEQRRLGLRRRAVDLVGKQEVRKDRARPELEGARRPAGRSTTR